MKMGAQAVHRSIAVLREVASYGYGGARLAEVVDRVGLNKATTRRLLVALCHERLLEQNPDTRCYRLGVESYVLGVLAAEHFDIRQEATDCVERLARVSHDTVFVATPSGTYSLCLHREDGSFPIRTQVLSAGQRHPLGIGAGGLALLAAMPDAEVEETIGANEAVVAERYPRYPASTMWRLVEETREAGYATNPGMVVSGSWAVGVAVRDERGYPLLSLTIAAIADRMGDERRAKLAGHLRDEAKILSGTLANLRQSRQSGGPQQSARG